MCNWSFELISWLKWSINHYWLEYFPKTENIKDFTIIEKNHCKIGDIFWPISLLPSISKGSLKQYQSVVVIFHFKWLTLQGHYGFREGVLTALAHIELFFRINMALNDKKSSIFMNPLKAFNTLNYEIFCTNYNTMEYRVLLLTDSIAMYHAKKHYSICRVRSHHSIIQNIWRLVHPNGTVWVPFYF